MSSKEKIEGYWWSQHSPEYPKPIESKVPFPDKDAVVKKLRSVEERARKVHYKGISSCRCCNTCNGSGEYSHKNWKWPEGLMHYIVDHNIEPSAEFKKEILNM